MSRAAVPRDRRVWFRGALQGAAQRHNPVDMPLEIGQTLREARISRGIELSDVEQATKIRNKYLRAIEDEQWEELPGDPYTTGFLRSYAEFLELDPDPLVTAYRAGHPRTEETPIPETMLPQPGFGDLGPGRPRIGLLVGIAVAALLAVVGVVALTGSDNGGQGRGGATKKNAAAGGHPATTTSTAQPSAHPAPLSLELRATDAVWVCLVEGHGRQLVDGETLTADEQRGPFEAHKFEVTFGNGAIEMTVDGRPVDVPDLGEPLGYSIDSKGVDRLGSSARPTCS
jgi:cytoskeleton protein RodZ